MSQIYYGDSLDLMKDVTSESIDLICADLPQGITKNKWDVIIPFIPLWEQYERIIKPNGAIVLFANQPFTSQLVLSNTKLFRYSLVLEKTSPTGFFNAKKMPLRSHEDILVFYKNRPTYNPQKTDGHPRKVSTAAHKRNSKQSENYGDSKAVTYDSTERYPKSVWKFSTDKQKSALHATQKPVDLIEEIIKTYSNQGDLVLDNTAGSGTLGIACINLNRNYILMEKCPKEFEKLQKRINEHVAA